MKYILFVLTILSSVGFYNYHEMFSPQLIKLMFYLNVLLCCGWALKDGISLREVRYPRTVFFLILVLMIVSAFMGTAFHPQSLMASITGVLPFFFSFLYLWVFLKFDIPSEKMMHLIMGICAASSVVYFCNVLTMPHNIFGESILSIDMTRGIVRIPLVFIELFPLVVFYGINRFIDTKEKKWLLVIAWAGLMIVLAVVRQIILLTGVLGLLFFFRKVSLWKKLAMAAAVALVVVLVLPQIPIYKAMVELSEDQRDDNEKDEDIRITAWRYYTYENQTNAVTPFFGNGIPSAGNSLWGQMFSSEVDDNGCFAADVGWAGFFWYFGGVATVCLIILIFTGIFRRKSPQNQFITYWLVLVVLSSFASGLIIYSWQIANIMAVLSIVFNSSASPDSTAIPETSTAATHTDATTYTLPKYPQL